MRKSLQRMNSVQLNIIADGLAKVAQERRAGRLPRPVIETRDMSPAAVLRRCERLRARYGLRRLDPRVVAAESQFRLLRW